LIIDLDPLLKKIVAAPLFSGSTEGTGKQVGWFEKSILESILKFLLKCAYQTRATDVQYAVHEMRASWKNNNMIRSSVIETQGLPRRRNAVHIAWICLRSAQCTHGRVNKTNN